MKSLSYLTILFIFFFSSNVSNAQDTLSLFQLYAQGEELLSKGQNLDAIAKFQEAQQLMESDDRFERADYYVVIVTIGYCYIDVRNYTESRKYLSKASRLALQLGLIEENIMICNDVGAMYRNQYNKTPYNRSLLDSIDYYHTQAYELAKSIKPKENIKFAECLFNLGTLAYLKNNPDKALEYMLAGFRIYNQVDEENIWMYGEMTEIIGVCYDKALKYDSSYYYQKISLAAKEAYHPEKHSEIGLGYYNVAVPCSLSGRFSESLFFIQEAIKIYEVNPFSLAPFTFYYNAGEIALNAYKLDLAEEFYLKAYSIPHKGLELEPSLYLKLVAVYIQQNNFEKAYLYLEKACKAFKENTFFGPTHPNTINICNGLNAYSNILKDGYIDGIVDSLKTTDTDKIVEHIATENPYLKNILASKPDRSLTEFHSIKYRKATELLSKSYKAFENEDYKSSIQIAQKAYAYAFPNFKDTLDIYQDPQLSDICLSEIYFLHIVMLKSIGFAMISATEHDTEQIPSNYIIELFEKGNSIISILRTHQLDRWYTDFIASSVNQFYSSQANFYLAQYKKTKERDYQIRAIQSLEKKKGLGFITSFEEKNLNKFSPPPQDILHKEDKHERGLEQIWRGIYITQEQLADSNFTKFRENLTQKLDSLRDIQLDRIATFDFFKAQLRQQYPTHANLKYGIEPTSFEVIQSSIDDRTALISYYHINDELFYAFVHKDEIRFHSVGKIENLKEKVQIITDCLDSLKCNKLSYQKEAFTFFQLLIPKLPDQIDRLIISPDGPLVHLPFELLATNKVINSGDKFSSLPYLIKRYAISYTLSPTVLYLQLQKQQKHYPKKLLYYQTLRSNSLSYYKTNIKGFESFAEVRPYSEATKTRLLNEDLKSYQIIHLASHSVAKENARTLYIHFESDSKNAELYYDELMDLDMKTDLLILDACQSGAGEYKEGEGFLGMTRGALFAGAENALVAKNTIRDKATGIFFSYFYNSLLSRPQSAGRYAYAVQHAKLEMTKHDDTAHPEKWAGFYLEGH